METLVAQCAIEQDFYVRDMLTWALTRFPSEIVVPRLLTELHSENTQARSQALHTLSKIEDPKAWPAITQSLIRDTDDEVARSAWRAAVVLVPETQKKNLAEELARQMGRGNREMQLSLSSALVTLGEASAPCPTLAPMTCSPKAETFATTADSAHRFTGLPFPPDRLCVDNQCDRQNFEHARSFDTNAHAPTSQTLNLVL